MASLNRRDITLLYLTNQYSIQKISSLVGCSENTVRRHLLKHRVELRNTVQAIERSSDEKRSKFKQMYEVEQKSIPEISNLTGVAKSTVRYHLLRAGVVLRDHAQAGIMAAPKISQKLAGKNRGPRSENVRAKIAEARLAWGQSNASGISRKPNGYFEITRGPNKGRLQHVVIMEEHIGRKIRVDECVHHKDGQRDNNALSNLELLSRSEHARLHAKSRKMRRGENGRFVK